jgi:hypothetical protein
MMKKMWSVGVAMITLAGAAAAHADQHHGTVCQPTYDSSLRVGYEEQGVGNYSTTATAEVFCPLDPTESSPGSEGDGAPHKIRVFTVDNNMNDPFYCYAFGVWADGSGGAWASNKHACTFDPVLGCNGDTLHESLTGYRAFGWDLTLHSDFQNVEFDAFGVRCYIPKRASTSTPPSFVKVVSAVW